MSIRSHRVGTIAVTLAAMDLAVVGPADDDASDDDPIPSRASSPPVTPSSTWPPRATPVPSTTRVT